jgi:hypothetical protein
MSSEVAIAEIRHRYEDLERWANAFTASLESAIRTQTKGKCFHCFVMDQFEEAYPTEHLTRDRKFVHLSLRVAIDLRDLDQAAVRLAKATVLEARSSLRILSGSFHDDPKVIDLDWHVSEKEKAEDEGAEFAKRVLADCALLVELLETIFPLERLENVPVAKIAHLRMTSKN